MVEQANEVCVEMGIENAEIKRVDVQTAVGEAEASLAGGTDIIIARGYYALKVKKALSCPVVSMRITAQELCVLICEAKKQLQKQRLVIGLCGFANMYCNTDKLDEIFDVTLRPYFVEREEDLETAVDRAVSEQVDIIIGGDISCGRARERFLPHLMLATNKDSIREALSMAQQMAYVGDLEKKNAAEWAVLLDYSFGGIIRLDEQGKIIALNLPAQNILKKESASLIGLGVNKVVREINDDVLKDVLINGNERFSISFVLNNNHVIANFAPILVDGQIHGAVLSCHEVRKIVQISESLHREQYQAGHIAVYSFGQFGPPSREMGEVIAAAKRHADTDVSVLIAGEPNAEKDLLAEAMHNEGPGRDFPFVTIYCQKSDILSVPEQGRKITELSRLVSGGTLYLRDVETLSTENQVWLLEFLQGMQKRVLDQNGHGGIKVIASVSVNLWQKVLDGDFLEELYYKIAVVRLEVPALYTRRGDIRYWVEYFLDRHRAAAARYVTLTNAAKTMLENYEWTGNLAQIDHFCQSLVMSAQARTISEQTAARLLEQLYPEVRRYYQEEDGPVTAPQGRELIALLERYGGNRSLVMKELNISRSTLWRRMKKYNIHNKYQ
ncbi:MAG: PrpR N-terminal domain-containing protein [Oscillospiraceae bacterium]|nr:PrpR N-terminal domain-containing protein [Oscillospiraceae bacterium]